jgi:hypothetical protein
VPTSAESSRCTSYVAGALQLTYGAQYGYYQAQVAGHRGLLSHEGQTALLDIHEHGVYGIVARAHPAGQLLVIVHESGSGQVDALLHHGSHGHDALVETLELLVVCVSHECSLPGLAEAAGHVVVGALVPRSRENLPCFAELYQYAPAGGRGFVHLCV